MYVCNSIIIKKTILQIQLEVNKQEYKSKHLDRELIKIEKVM